MAGDDDETVRGLIAAAGLPAAPEEIAVLVGAFGALRADMAVLGTVCEGPDVSSAQIFQPDPRGG